MVLRHISDKSGTRFSSSNAMTVECKSGNEMSRLMHKVAAFCKNNKSKSEVVWDSNHYCITLWFEKEKYLTYFQLKGVSGFDSVKQEH